MEPTMCIGSCQPSCSILRTESFRAFGVVGARCVHEAPSRRVSPPPSRSRLTWSCALHRHQVGLLDQGADTLPSSRSLE